MSTSLTIGDFSRATHLTVKTLRHYHESGLLEPAHIDERTGYRHYSTEQIPVAQIIRRFRDLDMPLNDIRAVLSAPDLQTRNELISSHLRRLESELTRTQTAVSSLRDLLEHPEPALKISHRKIAPTAAAAITQIVDVQDALTWFVGALGELHAFLSAQHLRADGCPGGVFASEIFSHAHGEATVFVPCKDEFRSVGRVVPMLVPGAELAIVVHEGSYANVDLAYGTLAAYVTRHELAIDGPLREYYLVSPQDTQDSGTWRTEVGWPIFQTG